MTSRVRITTFSIHVFKYKKHHCGETFSTTQEWQDPYQAQKQILKNWLIDPNCHEVGPSNMCFKPLNYETVTVLAFLPHSRIKNPLN